MDESVVFFGSGPVAAESLTLLVKNFEVEAVITKPTTLEMMKAASPSSLFAISNRHELDELINKKRFTSRLAVLVDFGIIVSQSVIDKFELGIINSHFSLLPEWRGADPITFAILSGQTQTGVSLMLLVEKMDEGPLLAQSSYEIPAKTTTPQLTEKLIEISDAALKLVIPRYASGEVTAVPQAEISSADISYSRKLNKKDGVIDWQKPANQLEREVRAFIDWPKSRAWLGGIEVIITKASVDAKKLAVGEIKTSGAGLLVGCGDGSLALERIKPAGKQEMSTEEFLRGYNAKIGARARLISRD